MELVLDDLEEALRLRGRRDVVASKGEYLSDTEIDAALAGADVANPLEQLIEMVTRRSADIDDWVLESLIIENIPLYKVLREPSRGPSAKLGAADGPHPVANREDGLEGIMLDHACDFASGSALRANHPEFPDGSLNIDFSVFKNGRQVLADRADIFIIQLGGLGLTQPQGVTHKTTLDACLPIVGFIENQLPRRRFSQGYSRRVIVVVVVGHASLPGCRLTQGCDGAGSGRRGLDDVLDRLSLNVPRHPHNMNVTTTDYGHTSAVENFAEGYMLYKRDPTKLSPGALDFFRKHFPL